MFSWRGYFLHRFLYRGGILYLCRPSHSKDSFVAEAISVQELPQGNVRVQARARDVTVDGAEATVPQPVNAQKNDRSRARGLTRDNVGHAQVSFTVLWSDGKSNSGPPLLDCKGKVSGIRTARRPRSPRNLLKTSRFSELLPSGDETAATG